MVKDIIKNNFLVRVSCMTFNHAPYIEDAMNGFCLQKTTFPFVCVIFDDASTDGEQKVIKRYLQDNFDLDNNIVHNEETDDYIMTFAQHKTNENCFFAVYYLKYNHFSINKTKDLYIKEWLDQVKYVALCEGDDYWISHDKLQKQVEILQASPSFMMCGHAYNVVSTDKSKLGEAHCSRNNCLLSPGMAIENFNMPQYATLLFKAHYYDNRPDFFKDLSVGDYQLRVFFAINGGIYYIDEVMSSYRRLSLGSWTSNIKENDGRFFLHIEKMKVFAHRLDEYTNGKYHYSILKRLEYLDFLMLKRKRNLISILSNNYYKSLDFKDKTILLFGSIFPSVFKSIKILYNRL